MSQFIAQRVAFAKSLTEIARDNKKVVALDGDLSPSSQLTLFAAELPGQFYQMGIAEQNMFGVAAGMASLGLIPFAASFACFTAKRALDQIRVVIAQPKMNVKMVGVYCGLLTGKVGKTHISVQDIAVFRAMPNVVTVSPIDGIEVASAMRVLAEYQGPVYLRLTRDPVPVVLPDDYEFQIGKSVKLREGSDLTIIGTGDQSQRCLAAAEELAEEGVSARVVHMPTIKPLDTQALLDAAESTGKIVTAEDHSILGGLGGAVCEYLSEHHPVSIKRVGLKDTYAESGGNDDLMEKYGLTASHVAKAAYQLLG